jgi:hypothetical protein
VSQANLQRETGMPVQDFRRLLEAAIDSGEKRAAGPVKDVDELLKPQTLAALDQKHRGCYVLFIHQPEIDKAVNNYLSGPAPSNDTGSGVMALYVLELKGSNTAVLDAPGLGKIQGANALVEFARSLFPKDHPEIPGMLVLSRLSVVANPIYVPLKGLDKLDDVSARIRQVFALASEASAQHSSANEFADALSRSLAIGGVTYVRAEGKTIGDYFLQALRFIWESRENLVVLAKIGAKVFGGAG